MFDRIYTDQPTYTRSTMNFVYDFATPVFAQSFLNRMTHIVARQTIVVWELSFADKFSARIYNRIWKHCARKD